MQPNLEEKFLEVLTVTDAYLGTLGFKKGQSFRRHVGANTDIIEFRRSTANEEDRPRFTINMAVLSAAVAAKNGHDVEKLGASEGHLRERIRSLATFGGRNNGARMAQDSCHFLAWAAHECRTPLFRCAQPCGLSGLRG